MNVELIKLALNPKGQQSFAVLGAGIIGSGLAWSKLTESDEKRIVKVFSLLKGAVKALGDDINPEDRRTALRKESDAIFSKVIFAAFTEGHFKLADVPFSGKATGYKWFRLTKVKKGETGSLANIQAGQSWQSMLSEMAKVYEVEGAQAVIGCDKYKDLHDLYKAINERTKKKAEPETEAEQNDRSALYEVFATVTAGYDLTGNTLDAETLINVQAAMTVLMDQLDLRKAS